MANDLLAEVITEAFKSKDQKAVIGVLEMIRVMMERDKHLIVPVEWMEDAKASLHVVAEEGVQKAVFDKDTKLAIRHINGKDNEDWLVAFSSFEELQKGASTFSAPAKVKDLLEVVKATDVKGIVINPFGSPFLLGETMIDMIFEASKAVAEQEAKKAES